MTMLKPIRDYHSYSAPLAKEIYDILHKALLEPLLAAIKGQPELKNAMGDYLLEALRSGKFQYSKGFFIGNLNINISKELRALGATYNKLRKAYYLEPSKLPGKVMAAISQGNQKIKDKQKKVNDILDAMEDRPLTTKDLEPFFGDTLGKLDQQFYVTTKPLTGADLEIPIASHLYEKLRQDYTDDLNLRIKGWRDDQIQRLRKKMEKNVATGFRAERMVGDILREKAMTQRHARFIAKQETSLLTAAYRETRYEEIGIKEYIWSTSHDERVRPAPWVHGKSRSNNHRILDGRKFRFDKPPIVDTAKNRTANPGQDFGCRCIAIPYISHGVNFIKPAPALARLTAY
jgi:SPP1 gp7 family putative phage head morphogenesis protein